jgi:hypothetical protein
MKKIRYNSIEKAINMIDRKDNDNIRVAIYVNEEDYLSADLQLEYEDRVIIISGYRIDINLMYFWDFYDLARKKLKNESEKITHELEKRNFIVEQVAYVS